MGLVGLSRRETEDLGLIGKDEPVKTGKAALEEWDVNLKKSLETIDNPDMIRILKEHFGPQVKVDGGRLTWDGKGQRMAEAEYVLRKAEEKAQEVARALPAANLVDTDLLQYRAQVASVATGNKPLFHEEYLEESQASILAAEAKAAGLAAKVVGQSLYVWNPKQISWAEISQDPIGQPSGKLLGYGTDLLAPDSVVVGIYQKSTGNLIGGFHAPAESAHLYAKARLEDYTRVYGDDFKYKIKTGGKR